MSRLFEPPEAKLPGFSVSKLIVSSNKWKNDCRNLSQVRWFGERISQQKNEYTMVIGIDGACRNNGRVNATASCGIYFDANSAFNSHALLQDTSRQTSQLAEIVAATRALNKVETILCPHSLTDHVILITDSSYLAQGMSNHIYQWQMHDWKDTTGQKIVNRRAFQVLDGIIRRMERDGVSVQFWLVPRGENLEANRLANTALDQHEAKMAKKKSEEAKEKLTASAGESLLAARSPRRRNGEGRTSTTCGTYSF